MVIFGCGGFGREVAWAVSRPEAKLLFESGEVGSANIIGFLDDDDSTHGTTVNGYPVLGSSKWLRDNPGFNVMIGLGIPSTKKSAVPKLLEYGARFPSFIDPGATFGEEIAVGRGVVVCTGVIATCNIDIGDFSMVNIGATLGHDVRLGKYVTISPSANLSGYVEVGDGSDLGTDCTVIPGKKIGQNAVVGAMACVTKDIPDNATAVGVPAKVIKITT